jgi:trehalose 6-phosphate synthase/phosphatase
LSGVHAQGEHLWFGWPGAGAAVASAERPHLDAMLARRRVVPIELSDGEIDAYYDEVCNSVLWPICHSMIDRLPLALPNLETYRAVNERFARALAAEYRDGDLIWVHDYHLLLVPLLIRRRLPHASIGFFLHTPFPAADVFRVLPWRQELLEGLLGSSLIGFQTNRDQRHFEDAVGALTPCAVANGIAVGGRSVSVGTFPIGLDPARLASPRNRRDVARKPSRRLLVGVDRLDYTKGIPRRLLAFERLLQTRPDFRETTQLIQVAVPSRIHSPEYGALGATVEELVRRINSRYATAAWTPIRYVTRTLPPSALARLFRAADVMLVTSLRDGMNLVAKEFVMARTDEDGVLVLSELAGASQDLTEALVVNPYSVDQIAGAMAEALGMPQPERQQRMRRLRHRVGRHTVDRWAERFVTELRAVRKSMTLVLVPPLPPPPAPVVRVAASAVELRPVSKSQDVVESIAQRGV